ncbi:type III restriction-modification system endonuclease [uncultured Methanobrevibacter sp.]|uniref:type III restriction-modification system endonuclease n=1 Tax=uncultured Methanobrevibacter sp. TaxID=253161 RepID=UPI0025ECCAE9|nr:DEAD/DEAH box helicase family protein [uncultured Methanobrevibacter sp.]
MKLKFDSNLNYQTDAVNSVIDLFKGQTSMLDYFPVSGQAGIYDSGMGVSNKIVIDEDHIDILENLRQVQSHNKLAPSESLSSLDFNIEMETGTGKTYVYLKTIFELNKEYGFTKFIIVVPSLAIKEGVNKTIEITKEHFEGLYDNVPYNYFVYDSSKLEQIRDFAVSSTIQIMIINIDSFNKSFTDPSKEKKANIIHRVQEDLSGYKPIDLLAETNPIVIIDEPQSVMGGKGEKAVSYLNPLCTLRYSATHKEIQNLIYKLDAVDASELELVKQIEVGSLLSEGYHNEAYLRLVSVRSTAKSVSAKIEIDALVDGHIKRKTVNVKEGDDLSETKFSNREIYNGYVVEEIYCEKGNEYVSFAPKDEILTLDKIVGDIDDLKFKRAQIRRTIEEHLNKELNFANADRPIKVLSLFFIDKVSNYRVYNSDGTWSKGIYAKMFEEEYKKVIKKPKYSKLNLNPEADEVHYGYFSQDRQGKHEGKFKETKTGRADADDYAYELIMKDKERLLSFDSELKFIFSHSALNEGWDNPNVFQICTLNETKSKIKKRQEIGRGLRLCVDQNGDRVHDNSVNTLTIIANEYYEDFAKKLQKELEDDLGIKFGTIQEKNFSHIEWTNKKGIKEPLGSKNTKPLINHFVKMNYIDRNGKIKDPLKFALKNDALSLPEEYEQIREEITNIIEKITNDYKIKPTYNKTKVNFKEEMLDNKYFNVLWEKIKHKTTYSIEFDTEELVSKCIKVMQNYLKIHTPKLLYTKSGLTVKTSGVHWEDGKISTVYSEEDEIALPDIVTYLQKETDLTRKTIIRILKESNTLNQFKRNPQEYMQQTVELINKVMMELIVDGIKYTKINDSYSQELFKNRELFGYIGSNIVEAKNSIYDYVIYDSDTEKLFAEDLDDDSEIRLFAKLPYWFKIKTPLGNYNPDWAIVVGEEGEEKLYLVVETKGTIKYHGNRPTESLKIQCGKEHFESLDTGITFTDSDSYDTFKMDVGELQATSKNSK